MLNIAHMASYDRNIGDNSTIWNVRRFFESMIDKNINWTPIDIKYFLNYHNDSLQYGEFYIRKINNYDLLVIGGGGLLEAKPKNKNHFNLP